MRYCVLQECGLPDERAALLVAMAMLETTNMDVKQRDSSKDSYRFGSAANVTIFNLNVVSCLQLWTCVLRGSWGCQPHDAVRR